jgi:hypothetical protein
MNVNQKINLRASRQRHSRAELCLAAEPYKPGATAPAMVTYNRQYQIGRRQCRWVNNASKGMRLVGLAHKVDKRIQHTGWYTDEDGMNETLTGIVYRLPARNGRNRYLIGYADPLNDDAALLEAGLIEADLEDSGECESLNSVARAADRFAEIMAEQERDYNSAYYYYRHARAAMLQAQQAVLDCLNTLRAMRAIGLANPHEYAAAESSFADAWVERRESVDNAMTALRVAKKYGITWNDMC